MGHSSDDDKETLDCFDKCGIDDFLKKIVFFRDFERLIKILSEK